mmetsp:Transcript_18277/g.47771  ORF Transcript_18277/g.47771 Transcript_18277/m.47771 type:complete len:408 (+) Transcript_18277:278-1501(+)
MAFVTALMAESGLPLFTRASKGLEMISFAAMGSLFGITTFVEDQKAKICGARTNTAAVRWKTVHEVKLLLVVVTDNDFSTDDYIEDLLDLVYAAIVFTLGEGELKRLSVGSEELYRLALKKCYPLIDALIGTLRSPTVAGPTLQCVDRTVTSVDEGILAAVDRWVYGATAKWGFLLCNGKVLAADSHWWDLRWDERILLAALPPILPDAAEATIYLPCVSPSVAFRLVTIPVIPGVLACLLCGAEPSLKDIESQLVKPVWSGLVNVLKRLQARPLLAPPIALAAADCVVGMLIVDTRCRWSIFTVTANAGSASRADPKLAAVAYFKSVVGPSVMKVAPPKAIRHAVAESYTVTTNFKLYYMTRKAASGAVLSVVSVFLPGVPTYSLRHLTTLTFGELDGANVFPLGA